MWALGAATDAAAVAAAVAVAVHAAVPDKVPRASATTAVRRVSDVVEVDIVLGERRPVLPQLITLRGGGAHARAEGGIEAPAQACSVHVSTPAQ